MELRDGAPMRGGFGVSFYVLPFVFSFSLWVFRISAIEEALKRGFGSFSLLYCLSVSSCGCRRAAVQLRARPHLLVVFFWFGFFFFYLLGASAERRGARGGGIFLWILVPYCYKLRGAWSALGWCWVLSRTNSALLGGICCEGFGWEVGGALGAAVLSWEWARERK